jgi:hypothetical protein
VLSREEQRQNRGKHPQNKIKIPINNPSVAPKYIDVGSHELVIPPMIHPDSDDKIIVITIVIVMQHLDISLINFYDHDHRSFSFLIPSMKRCIRTFPFSI